MGRGRRLTFACRRAFTLFEVLLVIAALVVLAGLVLPNLAGRQERVALDTLASRVGSLVSLARSTAMSTGRRHRCVVGGEGTRMWIEREVDPVDQAGVFEPITATWARLNLGELGGRCVMIDLSGLHKLIRAKEDELLDRELPEDVYDRIEFQPDGRCDEGILVLAGRSGQTVALELDALTGRVKVSDTWREEQSQ